MALGLVELSAIISNADYIKSPFAQVDCVYYEYLIQEYEEETTTDSDGNVETNSTWRTIDSGERRVKFYVEDDTGEVLVDPSNAEIKAPLKHMYEQTRGSIWTIDSIKELLTEWNNDNITKLDTSDWQLTPVDPNKWIVSSPREGDRRYYEYYLEPGERLFIMGTAASEPGVLNDIIIKKGSNEPTFLISYKSEEELLKTLKLKAGALIIFGCVLIIVGFIIGGYLLSIS
jgi:hypothetical protein